MYDVIEDPDAGLAANVVSADTLVVQIVSHVEVDLEPYGDAELSDAELLEHAHHELLAEQSRRSRVLAGGDHAEVGPVLGSALPCISAMSLDEVLVNDLPRLLAIYADLTEAALPLDRPADDDLAVRRERRITARVLRAPLGGVA